MSKTAEDVAEPISVNGYVSVDEALVRLYHYEQTPCNGAYVRACDLAEGTDRTPSQIGERLHRAKECDLVANWSERSNERQWTLTDTGRQQAQAVLDGPLDVRDGLDLDWDGIDNG